jgi:hypothetical protein
MFAKAVGIPFLLFFSRSAMERKCPLASLTTGRPLPIFAPSFGEFRAPRQAPSKPKATKQDTHTMKTSFSVALAVLAAVALCTQPALAQDDANLRRLAEVPAAGTNAGELTKGDEPAAHGADEYYRRKDRRDDRDRRRDDRRDDRDRRRDDRRDDRYRRRDDRRDDRYRRYGEADEAEAFEAAGDDWY